MVRRTQEAGELRPDITAEDVPTVVAMITTASVALNPADAQPLLPLPAAPDTERTA